MLANLHASRRGIARLLKGSCRMSELSGAITGDTGAYQDARCLWRGDRQTGTRTSTLMIQDANVEGLTEQARGH